MKKQFTFVLVILLLVGMTFGCESGENNSANVDSTPETSTVEATPVAHETEVPEVEETEEVSTPSNPATSVLPSNTQQAIVVIPAGWDDLGAQAYFLEKSGKKWINAFSAPAVLGKNGSAWGLGMHEPPAGERKKQEGDGRSPSGVFELGRCMGYAESPFYGHDWPYMQVTKDHIGVDDPASDYYNQVINIQDIQLNGGAMVFASFEQMLRKDDLYKWLFEVKHNTKNAKNMGSLIFFHLWRAEDKGTAGCTAVAEPTMEWLLNWIDKSKHPVLIQMPEEIYDTYEKPWGLPKFRH